MAGIFCKGKLWTYCRKSMADYCKLDLLLLFKPKKLTISTIIFLCHSQKWVIAIITIVESLNARCKVIAQSKKLKEHDSWWWNRSSLLFSFIWIKIKEREVRNKIKKHIITTNVNFGLFYTIAFSVKLISLFGLIKAEVY